MIEGPSEFIFEIRIRISALLCHSFNNALIPSPPAALIYFHRTIVHTLLSNLGIKKTNILFSESLAIDFADGMFVNHNTLSCPGIARTGHGLLLHKHV